MTPPALQSSRALLPTKRVRITSVCAGSGFVFCEPYGDVLRCARFPAPVLGLVSPKSVAADNVAVMLAMNLVRAMPWKNSFFPFLVCDQPGAEIVTAGHGV